MESLKIECSKSNTALLVTFIGKIDEDSDLSKIDLNGCTELTVDLEKVSGTNSCGIREWLKWVAAIPTDIHVTFLNCSRLIIGQINMVNGFLPKKSIIRSFYVPYYCDPCESITSVLYSSGKQFIERQVISPPSVRCSKCEGPTELDVVSSKYFRFLEGGS